jgi:hypothetical protein
MGEQFLADKAKGFKNKQDAQHKRHFESADLLTATGDRQETRYRFKSDKPGLKMIASLQFIDDGHEEVSVFHGMRRVGYIDAAGSADLRDLFAKFPALGNAVKSYICEEQDWTGGYTAKLSHSKH